MTWRPTASFENLRIRAEVLATIRDFFAKRNVLEVETPLLYPSSTPDPHLHSLTTEIQGSGKFYLQTSPEFPMKRLLAAGSGPIYQITKAFRDAELGSRHNPEFTMLEWYRPGFDHHALMDEVDVLIQTILATPNSDRISYRELFLSKLGFDPFDATIDDLQNYAKDRGLIIENLENGSKDDWLDVLMSHLLEPELGFEKPIFIYHYPASQAALAKLSDEEPGSAARFELYINGLELTNGFYELADSAEQRARFIEENNVRMALGLASIPLDELLLSALADDFPDCAGVALGVDRLVMIRSGAHSIRDVIAFPIA